MISILFIAAISASAAINESLFCDPLFVTECTKRYEKCVPCQPICPKTCENPDGRGFCNEQCLESVVCVCQEGYLRDIKSDECILPCECPINAGSTVLESSTTDSCALNR
ncbi:AAEL005094-PA [Aedes aegypti]|uniref:AAEL005094-PA n=1 Tax=Aedes aegypti TaxID=7159 RepID=Q17B35_AEDAE|nr:AAEL005094-PA [Aedes aegypti]